VWRTTAALLDRTRVRAAHLDRLAGRIEAAVARIRRAGPNSHASGPAPLLRRLDERGSVAQRRMLLISAQAAVLLLAFVAFAASGRALDARRGDDQLILLRAGRRQRAAVRLSASGLRAYDRGDTGAALSLLERASSLVPTDDPLRVSLLPRLGQSDAVEVIHQIKSLNYGGKVLLISGRDEATLAEIAQIGARHGLLMLPPLKKPFRVAEFQHQLSLPAIAAQPQATTLQAATTNTAAAGTILPASGSHRRATIGLPSPTPATIGRAPT
jgi:hypothetical protein